VELKRRGGLVGVQAWHEGFFRTCGPHLCGLQSWLPLLDLLTRGPAPLCLAHRHRLLSKGTARSHSAGIRRHKTETLPTSTEGRQEHSADTGRIGQNKALCSLLLPSSSPIVSCPPSPQSSRTHKPPTPLELSIHSRHIRSETSILSDFAHTTTEPHGFIRSWGLAWYP
jgi:hypothetical protein